MTTPRTMGQAAPWPTHLADLVEQCRYRSHEGWTVRLVNDHPRDDDADGNTIGRGTTLIITTKGYDTYHPQRGPTYRVQHYFIVPAATYNLAAWQRWLLEQFVKVETHEACENFVLDVAGVLERPFAPLHGPGCDPYTIHQYATADQRDRRYFDHTED